MSTRVKPSRRSTAVEPQSKQKLRVWLRLLRATRAIEADLRERLRLEFGSTLPRFDVLAALDRQRQGPDSDSGMTMTALSRRLLVSNGNATVIVARLVDDGLVRRLDLATDRRSTLVQLTPEGARQFRAMAVAHEAWIAEILASIEPDEATLLLGLLDRTCSAPPSDGEPA